MKPNEIIHNSELKTESAVAAALALAHRDPSQARITEERDDYLPPFLIAPQDITLKTLEHFMPHPLRPEIHIALHTARDLHAYVIAQTVRVAAPHSDNPVIFASRDKQLIKAYLDYHHADKPRWLNHTAEVQYRQSHQFKRWNENNNKHLTQEQFALFIDEIRGSYTGIMGLPLFETGALLQEFGYSL